MASSTSRLLLWPETVDTLVVARASIAKLEVNRREHSNAHFGLVVGAATGALGGWLAFRGKEDCLVGDCGEAGAVVFGILGALAGMVVGGNIWTNLWDDVPIGR